MQETPRELKRICSENLDRISCLPDEVISKILTHLPIRDAIATCALSRTWQYKWRYIADLVFDVHSTFQGQTLNHRIKFVDNVLLLHDGNINKFSCRNFLDSASPDLDRWLFLLSTKKLKHLVFYFNIISPQMIPSSLLYCQDLRILLLVNCVLQLPPQVQFNGFKNLVTLALSNVAVNQETIEFLVNNSPLLEVLIVNPWNSVLSHLSINAPNVKKIVMHASCQDIKFVGTPELKFLDIRTRSRRGPTMECKLDGILGGLVKIEMAKFSNPFIEFLSVSNFWDRIPVTYQNMKNVFLDFNFEDPKQHLAALWLFRNSPSLTTLDIKVYERVSDKDLCLIEFYETLNQKEAILQSLENFILVGFGGSENELRFLQFVLLHVSVLHSMKIKWKRNGVGGPVKERALLKLEEFETTLSGVKIELSG